MPLLDSFLDKAIFNDAFLTGYYDVDFTETHGYKLDTVLVTDERMAMIETLVKQ